MAEEATEQERALAEVRHVVLHLPEPKRSAITAAMMNMAPDVRRDALRKLRDGVKGEHPGVGIHEQPPSLTLPKPGEDEFEAADRFLGAREGCVYKTGASGLGYYRDRKLSPMLGAPHVATLREGTAATPAPAPRRAPNADGLSQTPCSELKSAGNALFKERQWKEAIGQYTAAVDRFDAGEEASAEGGQTVLISCLLNRAACCLKLKRYGSCAKDCTRVIELDPKSVKAWFRRGESNYQMKRVDEARDDLSRALQLSPGDKQIRKLYEEAKKVAGQDNQSRYWMENFDFSSGTFKSKGVVDMSLGEQLFRAASDGKVNGIRQLSAMPGCDLNTRVNGYTPLMSAASNGYAPAVEALASLAGVELLAGTEDGDNALHLAAREGHVEVLRMLCAALPAEDLRTVNTRGIDALMVAAFSGRLPAVQFLLSVPGTAKEASDRQSEGQAQAALAFDPAKGDAEGMTALHQAAAAGQAEVVRVLQALPCGARLVKLKTANGQTCLHKAAMGDTPGHVECVKMLAGPETCQVHPMQPDGDSLNAVLLAAAHGSLPVLRVLAGRPDCDLTEKSGSGQNAAHMAAMMGHVNVLHFLLHEVKPPVEPNTPDHRGWTPLHFAASQAREGVANYLVGISKVRLPLLVDVVGQVAHAQFR